MDLYYCQSHTGARDASLIPESCLTFLSSHTVVFYFFERGVSLGRKFVPLSRSHLVFLPFFFLFSFFTERKTFLDTRPTHGIYKFGVNPASGSAQSWRVDLLQRSELSWYLLSAVKNSILKKIYTFSIAFLELTISKKNYFFFKEEKNTFFPLHSHKS